jgi:tetratricopeptide (TPR) repeat protein
MMASILCRFGRLVVVASAAVAVLCSAGAGVVHALDHPDKRELLDMLRRGSLTKLERWLTAYQSGFENGRASDRLVDFAYRAFANSDPELAEALDRWVEKRPESSAARAARGYYYGHLGWIARGDGSAEETPDERWRAMEQFFALAEDDLKSATAAKPRLSAAYGHLISIAMARGNRSETAFLMQKGLDLAPHSFEIRRAYLLSLTPWRRSDLTTERSLAEIARYLEDVGDAAARHPDLRPLLGFADYVSAELLYRSGRYLDAETYFQRALGYGGFWWYHFRRGMNFLDNEQYIFALQDFDAALGLRPQVAEVHGWRGWAFRRMNSYPKALEEWELALELDSMAPATLRAKGLALRELGRLDEAKAAYDKAAFYGAYDHEVRAERGALLLHDLDDPAAAVEDLGAATRLKPDRPDYWRDYGGALFETNDCDAAAALATYMRLCQQGGECGEEDMVWAARGIQRITRGDCKG